MRLDIPIIRPIIARKVVNEKAPPFDDLRYL